MSNNGSLYKWFQSRTPIKSLVGWSDLDWRRLNIVDLLLVSHYHGRSNYHLAIEKASLCDTEFVALTLAAKGLWLQDFT